MDKKEKKEVKKIARVMDRLFDIALNLEEHCLSKKTIIFEECKKVERCKKKLLKDLNIIQDSVDELLGLDIVVLPGEVAKIFNKD